MITGDFLASVNDQSGTLAPPKNFLAQPKNLPGPKDGGV